MTSPPLLLLTAITKSFAGVQALRGVSFDLHPGEVHALVGENGAGKSTLIKIITGAHAADGGTLELHGRRVEQNDPLAARSQGIAAIYQQPALFPDLSVAENIALGLEPAGLWRRINWGARRKRAAELLGRIGARIDVDAEVRGLTMPEQQLVEIAALGADAHPHHGRPTASSRRREVDELLRVVGDLRGHGVGIVYISHRLDELFRVADRVTVLRDGSSVGTFAMRDVTHADLIRHMVGREISAVFPKVYVEPGDVVLDARGLGCLQGGVRGVSLELRKGEILGLAGLVGAGRTELARVLFGLTPADSGTIRLRGQNVVIDSPRRAVEFGIAYVPEDRRRHGVILDMPVAANTTLALLRRLFPNGWLRFGRERALANSFAQLLAIKTASVDAPVGDSPAATAEGVASGWPRAGRADSG